MGDISDRKPDLPFTVAITGHRQIAAEAAEALQACIVEILSDIEREITARATSSTLDQDRVRSFRFVSAAAEGADQIGARAAIAAKWSLHVVLPFPRAFYARTFADRDASALDAVLADAHRVQVLGDWEGGMARGEPGSLQAWWEARRYRTIGQLLVNQADLLIAVWRGTPSGGTGGTAEVMAEALRRGVPLVWINPDRPAAISITAQDMISRTASILDVADALAASPEHRGHRPALEAVAAALLFGNRPDAKHAEAYFYREKAPERTWYSLYSTVLWLSLLRAKSPAAPQLPLRRWQGLRVGVAGAWALPMSADAKLDGATANDASLASASCTADRIATRLGHIYRSAYFAIFALAASAVFLALLGLWPELNYAKPAFVIGELVSLSIAIGLWWAAHRRNLHRRWLDSRQIAERLRGTRVLAWIGFAGRLPSENAQAWTSVYIDAAAAQPGIATLVIDNNVLATQAEALRCLIQDQADYHRLNHDRLSVFHYRLDIVGATAVSAAAFVSLLYLLVSQFYHDHTSALYLELAAAAAFFGGVGPALASAIASTRYHGDFERFAGRSKQSAKALDLVLERLTQFIVRLQQRGQISCHNESPLFEEFATLCMTTQTILESDIEDWRFNFTARPMPLP